MRRCACRLRLGPCGRARRDLRAGAAGSTRCAWGRLGPRGPGP
ncbi:hypothetical protein I5U42_00550 [Stenotrophomonas maltophilia]|nr:hypothetical protein [Stenotrophomonas maltophilia]